MKKLFLIPLAFYVGIGMGSIGYDYSEMSNALEECFYGVVDSDSEEEKLQLMNNTVEVLSGMHVSKEDALYELGCIYTRLDVPCKKRETEWRQYYRELFDGVIQRLDR